MNYIEGFVDDATWGPQMDATRFPACIPTEVTLEELVRVLLKYADQHPENLHWVTARFATEAFKNAYPCSRS